MVILLCKDEVKAGKVTFLYFFKVALEMGKLRVHWSEAKFDSWLIAALLVVANEALPPLIKKFLIKFIDNYTY